MLESFIKNLKWREMIYDISPGTEEQLSKENTIGYIGFDATAPSLHVGNLATIMLLKLFQLAGHKPIILVGGATTMVGDPGGKKEERKLMDENDIRENEKKLKTQLKQFLRFEEENAAEILNNYDWHKNFTYLQFLREVGKHIPVSYMLAKDSVKTRLEKGLSYAEFSYQLLQGYDFYYLFKNKNVKIQMGGSDQWGNLTTGTELIRRKANQHAFALTTPLITKSDGTKFGKTESGTVWLDPKMTSPYKFYQFWLNCSDQDAEKFIKIFTLLEQEEIIEIINQHTKEPNQRILQKTLAKEITSMVHSTEDYLKSKEASEILFGKNTQQELKQLEEGLLLEIFEGVPKISLLKTELHNQTNVIDFLTTTTNNKIFSSKSEAKRTIQNGGLYINKIKIDDERILTEEDLLRNKYLLIQKGKKNYFLIDFK